MPPVTLHTAALTLTGGALHVLLDDDGHLPAAEITGTEPGLDQVAATTVARAGGPCAPRLLPLGTELTGGTLHLGYLALCPPAATGRWRTGDGRALPSAERQVLTTARARLAELLEHTTGATALLPGEFTIAELRAVYEATWECVLDPRNFHRKATGAAGFVVPTGRSTVPAGGGRPAELHRAGPAQRLHPALLRPAP